MKYETWRTSLNYFQDHSSERMKQLKLCRKFLIDEDPEANVIFGGDLNLRDKELDEIGGMPFGVQVRPVQKFPNKNPPCKVPKYKNP